MMSSTIEFSLTFSRCTQGHVFLPAQETGREVSSQNTESFTSSGCVSGENGGCINVIPLISPMRITSFTRSKRNKLVNTNRLSCLELTHEVAVFVWSKSIRNVCCGVFKSKTKPVVWLNVGNVRTADIRTQVSDAKILYVSIATRCVRVVERL